PLRRGGSGRAEVGQSRQLRARGGLPGAAHPPGRGRRRGTLRRGGPARSRRTRGLAGPIAGPGQRTRDQGPIAMSWLDGLVKNFAEIREGNPDPALRPITIALPVQEAFGQARVAIERLPRWAVVSVDPSTGVLHAIHRTRIWRFIDDIHLRL